MSSNSKQPRELTPDELDRTSGSGFFSGIAAYTNSVFPMGGLAFRMQMDRAIDKM